MGYSYHYVIAFALFLSSLTGCDVTATLESIEIYAVDRLASKYEKGVSALFEKRCETNELCLKTVAEQLPLCTRRATSEIVALIERPESDEDLAKFRTEYWIRNCVVSKSGFPLLYEIELASMWGNGPFLSDLDIDRLGVWHNSLHSDSGSYLLFYEILGWDWGRLAKGNQVSIPSFSIELTDNWMVDGVKRGVIGRIREEGHQLDGKWIAVFARTDGVYEPSTDSALYMFRVGVERPELADGSWPSFSEPPVFAGFAQVSITD